MTSHAPAPPSPRLNAAIAEAQEGVARRLASAAAADGGGRAVVSTPALLEELHQRKQALKQAATTPVERATIEIVALLFQSILMEDAIPATVRVWFARLQMPVLRVAVSEPDFFATVEHPARRLIDRMGSCVMGFDSGSRAVGDLLEKEIKRVVQVVEAYPDTGRRVFQTVLAEFEKFLEHYFKNENEASKKGVSLAQQVEQRETMAIQYTIELRKMLNDVPVQEGVREFLFQVWADVLATTAVKAGNADATKEMKRAAADLIWSASAKVSRAERAEVIRRLPPLLKTLRDGMDDAGIPVPKQDEHIQRLNNSLAAAFTAKAAAISHERLEELMGRLETLEELLPEAEDVDIDESLVMDLSGHESSSSRSSAKAARCRRRRCSPGRASCRSAAGTCSTTATATRRCSSPGRACGASSRCSSRRRGAACCSSSIGWRRSCRPACSCRRRTRRSPCARRAARWPSSTAILEPALAEFGPSARLESGQASSS